MKKLIPILLILLLLSLVLVNTAFASNIRQQPIGGCKRGFTLDQLSDHLGETQYLGAPTDRNGDGYICYQRLSPTVHRHIDNWSRYRCRVKTRV